MRTDKEYINTIKKLHSALKISESKLELLNEDIAIVGMGCRFPGVDTLHEFSTLLEKGKDSWSVLPKDRWDIKLNSNLETEGGFFIDDIDCFDNTLFKISKAEAKMMSPQQRILLETSWKALEHANIAPKTLKGSNTGVFMGVGSDDFKWLSLKDVNEERKAHFVSGDALSSAAGRLSYYYGFEGPNITINTACSSSLVAVDQALQAIKLNKCSTALVGGINLILYANSFLALEGMKALSPEGKCKGFDKLANGYGRGEGCGIVLLKKVSEALKDGNKIWAVIKGSEVNQDGMSNGLTAPNGLAQEKLLRTTLKNSNLISNDISYVEAHGTGTPLGDPIEIEAIKKVYDKNRSINQKLFISSVKSNIGHLENAAGIAALIKTTLSINNNKIYPQVNFSEINPKIDLSNSEIEIPKKVVNWPSNKIKRAGISSFGFSGTNAHIILEEFIQNQEIAKTVNKQVDLAFCLSAKSEKSLEEKITTYINFIEKAMPNFASLCYTAGHCRAHFKHRKVWITSTLEELLINLKSKETNIDSSNTKAEAFAKAYIKGKPVNWQQTFGEFKPIEIPGYIFEKNKFKINFIDPFKDNEVKKASQKEVKEQEIIDAFLFTKKVVSKITEIEVSQLNEDTDIFDYGVDSLMMMRMQKEVKSTFGVEISLAAIYDSLNTINKIASFIEQEKTNIVVSSSDNTEENSTNFLVNNISTQNKYVPYVSINKGTNSRVEVDENVLKQLIKSHNLQSLFSKEWTQKYRAYLANNRNIANFRPPIKEMTYQIVAEKANGAYIYDGNGKKYLDMSMGFGVHLFGHNPLFLKEAAQNQLQQSMALGPMSPKAGKLAKSICDLTGNDRAAFYNSGTEAIMVALRLSKTITKKEKVVIFSGSYHGTFDGILGVANDEGKTVPMAPGISPSLVSDINVLQYDDPESLAYIEANASNLAAVLVEPIQSRHPDLQPKSFLKSLREITEKSNTVLIFDEVITGFRLAIGGAQSYFDINSDLAVYGKVIGGGMPIGVVSGKKKFMDAVDGGFWSYGDKSFPRSENTFVAGTFCHHPLAMSTGLAVAKQFNKNKDLIPNLNKRNQEMCKTLNNWFLEKNIPVEMVHMGSLFRFNMPTGYDLIFYHLIAKGIYIWEGRNCFISTAHSNEDLLYFISTVKEAFTTLYPTVKLQPKKELFIEPTPSQKDLWLASQKDIKKSIFHLTETFSLEGNLDVTLFEKAFKETILANDAFQFGVKEVDGEPFFFKHKDFNINELNTEKVDIDTFENIEKIAKDQHHTDFNLENPPLWNAKLVENQGKFIFIFTVHHIICDGWSLELFFQEIIKNYQSAITNTEKRSKNSVSYSQYIKNYNSFLDNKEWNSQQEYWKKFTNKIELTHSIIALEKTKLGIEKTITKNIHGEELVAFNTLQNKLKVTPFVLSAVLAHVSCNLHLKLDKVVSISPVSGRFDESLDNTIGHLLNMMPIISEDFNFETLQDFSKQLNHQVEKGYQNVEYPYTKIEEEWLQNNINKQLANIEVSFENFGTKDKSAIISNTGLIINRIQEASIDCRKYPIEFRFAQFSNYVDLSLVYDPTIIEDELAQKLVDSCLLIIKHSFQEVNLSSQELISNVLMDLKQKESAENAFVKDKELSMLLNLNKGYEKK